MSTNIQEIYSLKSTFTIQWKNVQEKLMDSKVLQKRNRPITVSLYRNYSKMFGNLNGLFCGRQQNK